MEVENCAEAGVGRITGNLGNRRITKSAMEKKRRARINTSLTELKTMLAGMIAEKTERFDKLEKADILELTVKYVKQLQTVSSKDENITPDEKYRNGFNSCFSEVLNYINSTDSCKPEIRTKVLNHLAAKFNSQKCPKYNTSTSSCAETKCRKRATPDEGFVEHTPKLTKRTESAISALDKNNNVQLFEQHNAEYIQTETRQPPDVSSPILQNKNIVIESNMTTFSSGQVQFASPVNVNGQLTILVPSNVITNGSSCMLAVQNLSPILLTNTNNELIPSPVTERTIGNFIGHQNDNNLSNNPSLPNNINKTVQDGVVNDAGQTRYKGGLVYDVRQTGDSERIFSPYLEKSDTSQTKTNKRSDLMTQFCIQNRDSSASVCHSPTESSNYCPPTADNNTVWNSQCNNKFHRSPSTSIKQMNSVDKQYAYVPCSEKFMETQIHETIPGDSNFRDSTFTGSNYDIYSQMQQNISPTVHRLSGEMLAIGNHSRCESNEFQQRNIFANPHCAVDQTYGDVKHTQTTVWRPWNV